MKICIANDHAGYDLKLKIIKSFENNHNIIDLGADSSDSVDYPDYAHKLSNYVSNNNVIGILICGSGNGVSMAANKHSDIRAALCWNKEISKLARLHNDANVLSLPARYITEDEANEIVHEFINTSFEGGRHKRRADKINC
jgi:ribose 5-phosphate isomerase B